MAASLGSEGQIITLLSFSIVALPDGHINVQPGERGAHQHMLPLWLHGIPQHQQQRHRRDAPRETGECCPCNREHMLAGENALYAEGGHGETNIAPHALEHTQGSGKTHLRREM